MRRMAGARAHLVDAYCHGVLPRRPGPRRLRGPAARHRRARHDAVRQPRRFRGTPLVPAAARPRTALPARPATSPAAASWARTRPPGCCCAAPASRAYLVDTGEPGDLTSPKELGAAAGAAPYEIVRLEPLAQQVADTSGTVDGFLANLAETVHGAALGAAGFSCARRSRRPRGTGARARGRRGRCEVRQAAAHWLAARAGRRAARRPGAAAAPAWHAVATGLPLVLRYGPAGRRPGAGRGASCGPPPGSAPTSCCCRGRAHESAAADLAADARRMSMWPWAPTRPRCWPVRPSARCCTPAARSGCPSCT